MYLFQLAVLPIQCLYPDTDTDIDSKFADISEMVRQQMESKTAALKILSSTLNLILDDVPIVSMFQLRSFLVR